MKDAKHEAAILAAQGEKATTTTETADAAIAVTAVGPLAPVCVTPFIAHLIPLPVAPQKQ
jgi:hypothetical protein